MLVHSLWDQEDIYGAPAVYKALEPKDTRNDKVFLVMGPWHHGQEIDDGSSLGALKFGSDTALYFRQRDPAAVPRSLPEGRRAEDGRRAGHGVRDRHEHVAAAAVVAAGCASGCACRADAAVPRGRARRSGSTRRCRRTRRSTSTSPIPPSRCRSARGPSSRWATSSALTWPQWLVDDQREASGRPDVLAFASDVADGAGQDQRAAGREPGRVDERHRRRLGREADRRLSRRSRRRSRRWAATS